MLRKEKIALLSLCVFYLILFLPTIGLVHLFDWDEINFAEAAREMVVTGDWFNVQINYEPFWEKPPLFIWLQAISFSILGVSEFAARLPNVIVGLVTIIVLFTTVIKRYTSQAAILAVLVYLGSITSHMYFKSGIIDPLFNLLMFGSVVYLIKAIETKKLLSYLLAGILLGLSVLTKGPVSLLIVGLTGLAYQLIYKNNFYSFKSIAVLALGLLLPVCLYFGVQIAQSGLWFVQEFVAYQFDLFLNPVASHGQPFYYHMVVLLIGCFPAVVLALPVLVKGVQVTGDVTYINWMKVMFWVVLILFSLVTTKIIHYSSMCYLPAAALAGIWLANTELIKKWQKVSLVVISLIWSSAMVGINYYGMYMKNTINNTINPPDPFLKNQLESFDGMGWNMFGFILAIGFLVLAVYVIVKYTKPKLVTYLTFNVLIISGMLYYFTPLVERFTQTGWIHQLESYQGKEMMHFTSGFKSYAHIYYTNQVSTPEFVAIKKMVLQDIGHDTFLEMSQTRKGEYNRFLMDYVLKYTDLPLSISTKKEEEFADNVLLKEVFLGNGYFVYERK